MPRITSPRMSFFLWAFIGLLVLGAGLAWNVRVPILASGPAVVVDATEREPDLPNKITVIAFLPPETLSSLRVGNRLSVDFGHAERLYGSVTAIEPEISSPNSVHGRFGLNAGASLAVTRPSAVVFAQL